MAFTRPKNSRPSSEGVNISIKLVPCGEFGSTYLVKATAGYTLLPVCGVFPSVHTVVWLPMFGFFNTCTDVNASDCTPTKVWLPSAGGDFSAGVSFQCTLTGALQERCYPCTMHSYLCVSYFHVCKQCYGCQCLEFFNVGTNMIPAIVHRGHTDTIREFALGVDSWRKIPCFTRDSNPHQYCPWLFSWLLYQLRYTRLLFPRAGCRGSSWCWRSSPWWWPGDCWSSECLLPTLSGTCCSAGCSGSSRRFPCWPGHHSDKDTGLHHPASEMMERMFVNLIETGCTAASPYWFTIPERFLPFFPGLARCV